MKKLSLNTDQKVTEKIIKTTTTTATHMTHYKQNHNIGDQNSKLKSFTQFQQPKFQTAVLTTANETQIPNTKTQIIATPKELATTEKSWKTTKTIATPKAMKTQIIATPKELATTEKLAKKKKNSTALEKFDNRHWTLKFMTVGHQKAQRRILGVLDSCSNPIDKFAEIAATRGWRSSTQASYWATYLSARGEKYTQEEARYLKHLQRTSNLMVDTIQPAPMTSAHIRELAHSDAPMSVKATIISCWTLGQRLSDFLNILRKDVMFFPEKAYIAFTIRHGKVTAKTGPFSVFLPATFPPAQHLHLIASKSSSSELFSDEMKLQVTRAIHRMHLDLRSVRRGGLQHLAMSGVPTKQLLDLSRHTSEGMLRRYLNFGTVMAANALEQTSMVNQVTQDLELNSCLGTSRQHIIYTQLEQHPQQKFPHSFYTSRL